MPPGPAAFAPVSAIAAVKFVFSSGDWKSNVLFGLVLNLIPIAGPIALCGWLAEMNQRLVRRHPEPLPKFDFADFVHYLTRGVMVFLVSLVVSLPIGFAIALVVGVAVFGGVLAGAGTDGEPLVIFGVWALAGLTSVVVWLVLSVFMNAAQTRVELTEDFGQALNLGKVWDYARATWATVLVKNIVFGLVAFGLILAGMLLCYVGIYPAIAVIQIAAAHLRWQVYEQYLRAGGEPIALKPPQWIPSEAQRYQRGY
jgi:hypothetical protein